jgi:diguanylate cyclase (GGDEF)-like protein
LTFLLSALLVLVVLAGLGAAAHGVLAMRDWHHQPQRFLFAAFGTLACGAVAALAADALLSGTRGAGWRMPARLLADAMVPLAFVLVVQAYRRADKQRLKLRLTAPVNQQTSLPNRALLIDQAIPAMARCLRDQVPASVVAASIDGLDEIARTRGPRASEVLLRDFAAVFRDVTRAGDVTGHAGTTTLAALLPSATAEAATLMAARLRREASARLAHPAMDGHRVTLSVGISPVGDGPIRAVLEEAIHAADSARAAACAAGGDRVQEAPAPPLRTAGQPP